MPQPRKSTNFPAATAPCHAESLRRSTRFAQRPAAARAVRQRVAAALCGALLAWTGAVFGARPAPPPGDVQVWITTQDHRLALAPAPAARWEALAQADIRIDAAARRQRMLGFGASITDSSAWVLQQLPPARRDALMRELFGRADGGLGLSFARLTIGASDFSRRHYSLDDTPDNAPDPALAHFSIAPNRDDVLPVARQALAINPDLKIMASPWSAPAWMKSSGSLIGGTLKPEHYDAFARYLLRYVDAYAQAGVPIFALTLQNEPGFTPPDYPGMRLDAAQRAQLIGRHLGPLLDARGGAPLIFDWDHNWDQPQEPLAVLADAQARRHVAGVAWHCYAGDPAAQSPVQAAHPDKDAYMTECSGGDWEPLRSGGLTLQARRLIVQSVRHGARGVLFWNLALDLQGGPHAGGCGTCRGVVDIDPRGERVVRSDEYYALAHASRFVRPQAWRIDSSEGGEGMDNVAFLNPDGARVLVVVNSADRARVVTVAEGARGFRYSVPARSLASFVWPAPAAGVAR
ncbi:glycosyl hydrolase [Xanthomonas sp. AM6]|uniref:glycoside hydrolase family 30 protein n=1 Tax=Xanthomonas sp. AM6 TaxID=2982531 RepID=UPI0021DAF9D2|nr:glycoside hydrolase family 30 beta sandwich domain-containing protein [Xanthomonas sp. AM6]UYB53730.1 glycosyl hydrolase [Xanthomonas sp. AM6]